MAWTYSGDPSTSESDRYRFLIGDTLQDEPVLQDEEIAFVLSESESHNKTMYELFNAAANRFARQIKKSLGPQDEDPTERLNYFRDKAREYEKKLASVGVPTMANSTKTFFKGMHDNV